MTSSLPTPLRVLLVEDHADTLRAVGFLLERLGYSVVAAGTMQRALTLMEDRQVDILVCDILLPDGDGRDLLGILRRDGKVAGVAMSGYGSREDQMRSSEAGFRRHLTKPFSPEDLCNALEEISADLHGSG